MRPVLRRGISPLFVVLCVCFSWFFSGTMRADGDSLQVASFNIQVFGQAKMKKEQVVSTLLRILDRYDLIFIMEIRDNDDASITELLDRLNKSSVKNYQMILSERLGRTSSKEQYAYFFNTDKVSPDQAYVFNDSQNQFEREPYVAHFKAGATAFTLLGIHTTPSDVKAELKALGPVYNEAKRLFQEPNIYVIGDLNADCSYYNAAEGFNYFSDVGRMLLPEGTDTTVSKTSCNYDRVLAFGDIIRSTASVKVFNFAAAYGMTEADAKLVSDHYPVEWSIGLGLGMAPKPQPSGAATRPVRSSPVNSARPAPSCGSQPTLTPGGYCYADINNRHQRVANACCL